MGQIEDLLVVDQVQNVRHRGIVGTARVVFVFPQRPHQVVLPLSGQAGNTLFTRIIPIVAEVAAVLLDEGLGPFHAGGIGGIAGRWRRWQLRNGVRQAAQIVVAEPLRHPVHDFDDAHSFPEHEQLDEEVESRLSAERGHVGDNRLPFLAVAG